MPFREIYLFCIMKKQIIQNICNKLENDNDIDSVWHLLKGHNYTF